MRGSKAKEMRREDPSRPNPGRLGGGSTKETVKAGARGARKIENVRADLLKNLKKKNG